MNITKKAKIEYVKNKLATSAAWQLRALEVIFSRQTTSEQHSDTTQEVNDIGFSGAHAEIGSSLAKQYLKRRTLSPKQMAIVAKIMPRYWKQVMSVIPDDKLIASMYKDKAIDEVQAFGALVIG